jgi:hypothetical protein
MGLLEFAAGGAYVVLTGIVAVWIVLERARRPGARLSAGGRLARMWLVAIPVSTALASIVFIVYEGVRLSLLHSPITSDSGVVFIVYFAYLIVAYGWAGGPLTLVALYHSRLMQACANLPAVKRRGASVLLGIGLGIVSAPLVLIVMDWYLTRENGVPLEETLPVLLFTVGTSALFGALVAPGGVSGARPASSALATPGTPQS